MKHFKHFLQSFVHAFAGIKYTVARERNFRVHLVITAYVCYFQGYYNLTAAELAVLALTIGTVLAAELLNTAVERAIDLISPTYHNLAKTSKDAAAGAVLLVAATSLVVGFILFARPLVLETILFDFLNSVSRLFLLLLSIVAALWFVFGFEQNGKKKKY